jgi:hypothetical protein
MKSTFLKSPSSSQRKGKGILFKDFSLSSYCFLKALLDEIFPTLLSICSKQGLEVVTAIPSLRRYFFSDERMRREIFLASL